MVFDLFLNQALVLCFRLDQPYPCHRRRRSSRPVDACALSSNTPLHRRTRKPRPPPWRTHTLPLSIKAVMLSCAEKREREREKEQEN